MNITPRHYRNMTWSLLPKNRIDTVVLSPISNVVLNEPSVIATENFAITSDLGEADKYYHAIRNTYSQLFYGEREYAKGYVGAVISYGSRRVYVEQPTQGQVSAKINISGESYRVARGGSTYENYPDSSQMVPNTSLAQWVKDNHTEQVGAPTWTYDFENYTCKMNPFVRNFIKFEWGVLPTENDIITKWWNSAEGRAGTKWDAWTESTNVPASQPTYQYSVDSSASQEDPTGITSGTIYMRDATLAFSVNVRKLDDHNFQIDWACPTRLTYLAASRQRGTLGTYYDVDNYAILDVLSNVQIQLWSYPFSTEVVEKSYSLDSDGSSLTEQISGRYPFKINAEEALTTGTLLGETPWTTSLAKALLQKYKDGKYVVSIDVTAKWALENNIKVKDEQHVIVQQDGQPIKRNGTTCQFIVCNITRRFKGSEFIFTLDLMEV